MLALCESTLLILFITQWIPKVVVSVLNPLMTTNGLSLDESFFILGASGVIFHFLFHFSMKVRKANRIAPDGTPRFAASHLGLFCLPMSHKKDARLICVKHYLVV